MPFEDAVMQNLEKMCAEEASTGRAVSATLLFLHGSFQSNRWLNSQQSIAGLQRTELDD